MVNACRRPSQQSTFAQAVTCRSELPLVYTGKGELTNGMYSNTAHAAQEPVMFDLQVSDEPDSLTRTFLSPAHQRASKQVSRH